MTDITTLLEENRALRNKLDLANRVKKIAAASPYLHGDGAASEYLAIRDPQGRAFRKWADKHNLRYNVIGGRGVRIYRKADVDKLWADSSNGGNPHGLRSHSR